MRLAVTVVSPAAGRQADVVIDADPATPVAEVAVQLAPELVERKTPVRLDAITRSPVAGSCASDW